MRFPEKLYSSGKDATGNIRHNQNNRNQRTLLSFPVCHPHAENCALRPQKQKEQQHEQVLRKNKIPCFLIVQKREDDSEKQIVLHSGMNEQIQSIPGKDTGAIP
jgi:hypothetical protein